MMPVSVVVVTIVAMIVAPVVFSSRLMLGQASLVPRVQKDNLPALGGPELRAQIR